MSIPPPPVSTLIPMSPMTAITPVILLAPVSEVTVLEDRAHVTRQGSVTLPAGAVRLTLAGISPVLADKTLQVTARDAPQAALAVAAVRVARTPLIIAADQPEAGAAREAERRRLAAAISQGSAALTMLDQELETVQQLGAQTVAEITTDAAWSTPDVSGWNRALDAVAEREQALGLRRLALQRVLDEQQRQLADLLQRWAAANTTQTLMSARLEVDLQVAVPGTYRLQVSYLVPAACWRPYHTAEASDEVDGQMPATVRLGTDACVWQNTGEDWTQVRLRCSTVRSSLGTAPPLLSSDPLTLQKKETALVVEVRSQAIETTGGAAGVPARTVMGIDDGGEAQVLCCDGLVVIPSDGMPHRLPLGSMQAPAQWTLLVCAELSPAAILRSRQANGAATPLLAGPVDLMRRGGLAGRASVLFVAPQASFDIGWGPDGDIRVHRTETRADDKAALLSSWTATIHTVVVSLSNLSDRPRTLTVLERIPVSTIEQVRIECDTTRTSPAAQPDAQGIVPWIVTLPGRGQSTVTLHYRITRHGSVVGV